MTNTTKKFASLNMRLIKSLKQSCQSTPGSITLVKDLESPYTIIEVSP